MMSWQCVCVCMTTCTIEVVARGIRGFFGEGEICIGLHPRRGIYFEGWGDEGPFGPGGEYDWGEGRGEGDAGGKQKRQETTGGRTTGQSGGGAKHAAEAESTNDGGGGFSFGGMFYGDGADEIDDLLLPTARAALEEAQEPDAFPPVRFEFPRLDPDATGAELEQLSRSRSPTRPAAPFRPPSAGPLVSSFEHVPSTWTIAFGGDGAPARAFGSNEWLRGGDQPALKILSGSDSAFEAEDRIQVLVLHRSRAVRFGSK